MGVPELENKLIQLVPWGLWLNLTKTLNTHIVTDIKFESNDEKLKLAIHLERISGPFWFSLFIPSICLVCAAEVTLFINEKYFDALIVVALTSNLVTYNLYSSVHELLPQVSSLKLIDIWLLHGLLMPMVVFITLVANEMINSKDSTNSKSKMMGKQKRKDASCNNSMKSCMRIWKAVIPAISGVFIISFFMICLNK